MMTRTVTLILRLVFAVLLVSLPINLGADSCPYCGQTYGEGMGSGADSAYIARIRAAHEAQCGGGGATGTSYQYPPPDPDHCLNLMSPFTIPVFTCMGLVDGLWQGGVWFGRSLGGADLNYFTHIDTEGMSGPMCDVSAIGWQFQIPRVFEWIGGSPFLVLYGVPWLAVKGVQGVGRGVGSAVEAMTPAPDPRVGQRAEMALKVAEARSLKTESVRAIRQESVKALAEANRNPPKIEMGPWNQERALLKGDRQLPRVSEALKLLPDSTRAGIENLRPAAQEAKEGLHKAAEAYTNATTDGLKSRVFDFADAALDKAGVGIRVGSVMRFKDELVEGYVKPTTEFLSGALPALPSILAYGPKTDEEQTLSERHGRFMDGMIQKVGKDPGPGGDELEPQFKGIR